MKITSQIIQQLTSKVEVERIYQFTYHFLDQEYHHLLIVLNSKCGVSPATLEPTIDMCLEEAKGLTYIVIPSGQLKAAIKGGDLFYAIICQGQNLCYHDGKKPIPNISKGELELIKINSGNLFYSSQKRAIDFMEGMEFYTKKDNYHQAAFMLHQAAEQSIRGVLHAIFNKDKPGYSMQAHLKTISCFIPALANLFPKDNLYEYGLLQQLDKAYTTVRNKNNYLIEEEELGLVTSKIQLLLAWSDTFYSECLNTLEELIVKKEQRQNTVQPVLTSTSPTEPNFSVVNDSTEIGILSNKQKMKLSALIDKIRIQHPVSQIKVLGVKTFITQTNSIYNLEQLEEHAAHCYLLVILKGSLDVRSFTSNQGDLKITMLIHYEKEIEYALKKYNRFFIHSLQIGADLYKSTEHTIQFIIPEPDWQHSLKSANHFFDNRLERLADMFLASAELVNLQIDNSGPEACLILLSQCIEQVCISYIYINTGYRVNNHHLPFLLDLCGLIDGNVLKNLDQNTNVEKREMEALKNCLQYIRNKSRCTLGKEDVSNLLKRCKNLVEEVKKNCQTELDGLKKLAHTEEEVKLTD